MTMAKVNKAPFAQSKVTGIAVATAANTNYTAPTAVALLVAAGAEGGLLRRITAIPLATVTATQLQFYRSLDAGVTKRFWRSSVMPAYTMGTTTAAPVTDLGIDFELAEALAPNEEIYFAIAVANATGIVATAQVEDF